METLKYLQNVNSRVRASDIFSCFLTHPNVQFCKHFSDLKYFQ